MILLDTSFIIDLLREKNNAVLKAKELENKDAMATTCINVYELLLGVYSMKNINHEEKLHEAEILLDKLEILSLGKTSAKRSAKIGGELTLTGQIIGDTDNLIADIALANNINTIVTRDKEHSIKIKDMKAETY